MTLPLDEPEDLTDDALTGRLRVWQRRRGHRYSLDDVATAWAALWAQPQARTCLDLGCGLGSVLLMAADRLPEARLWGLEAQTISYELALRNVVRNALEERVIVRHGDLRDDPLLDELVARATAGAGFELVTGTPPYKPAGTATPARDSQRAHARMELRGGVPEYLRAVGRTLAPAGLAVVCAEAGAEARIATAAASAGLCWVTRLDVIPMAGRKGRLFAVHGFCRPAVAAATRARLLAMRPGGAAADGGGPAVLAPLIARDASGARTEEAHQLRRFFGLDPSLCEGASPPLRARQAPARDRLRAEKLSSPSGRG